jgi:putative ABC transport system permease protein
MIFLGIGAVLLVIACTNLGNLLLSRSAARARELAIRKAVGATARRLLRQHLTESLCLAALGGALGIAIAAVGVRVIDALSPLRLPIIQGITIDARVLGFGVAVSIAAALVVGSVPALLSIAGGFRSTRSGVGATARVFPRTQKALAVVQIGLSVGSLAAAGVLSHSLWRLNTVDRGFVSEQVIGFQLNATGPRDEWIRGSFVDPALDEIASIPGVGSVGYITFLPPETWASVFARFRIDGPQPESAVRVVMSANTLTTSARYFETVGMSLIRGRRFDAADDADSPPVMIVNEAFARTFLPGEDVVGRRVFSDFDTSLGKESTAREIVGVVNDTRDRGLDQRPAPTIYLPYRQGTLPYGAIAVRARVTPSALIPEIRRRLRAIDPDVPITDFETLDARVRESLRQPRFYASLAAACAGLAVLFVTVGLYGVVAYSVSRRTVELGVRMALGSSQGRILGLVLRQGAAMALIGAGLGVVVTLGSTRGLASLLFEIDPLDPLTLGGSVVLVVAVALLAAFVPARRACTLSPMTALRHD